MNKEAGFIPGLFLCKSIMILHPLGGHFVKRPRGGDPRGGSLSLRADVA
jgi:hypothetical protein